MIDLRSDTVTRPSDAMRRAMMSAEVGDDVLDGDPTTARLERRVAELLGMEAALFFPSGTQANQAALWVLSERGTEVVLEQDAHLIHYELGGVAALSGVQVRPVPTPDGVLTRQHVEVAWRPDSRYTPRASVLAAENTHNASGGRVMPAAVWDELVALAGERDVPLHLDGARLWNAAVSLGESPARLARGATTVMVSFSKGLGCPVGSCLAGGASVIRDAWEARKRLGGGMRQTGILAAAALYALEHNLGRLAEDHVHARLFAERLADHPIVVPAAPDTNIVMLALRSGTSASAVTQLEAAGVRLVAFGRTRLRAVFHADVSREEAARAADTVAATLGES